MKASLATIPQPSSRVMPWRRLAVLTVSPTTVNAIERSEPMSPMTTGP